MTALLVVPLTENCAAHTLPAATSVDSLRPAPAFVSLRPVSQASKDGKATLSAKSRLAVRRISLAAAGIMGGACVGRVLVTNSGTFLSMAGGTGGGGWGRGGGGGGGGGGGFRRILSGGVAYAAEDDSDDSDESDDEDEEEEEEEEEDEEEEEKAEAAPEVKPREQEEKKETKKAAQSEAFDAHGMRTGTRVGVTKLSTTKRYKVSGIELVDSRNDRPIPRSDGFYEMVTLQPGAVCSRGELETEVQNMAGSGMFQGVEADTVANADGSIKLEIKVLEAQWQPARTVRCVNMGLVPADQPGPAGEAEQQDPAKAEAAYRERLRQSRRCMLPTRVERELSQMVSSESRLTARLLQKIRDRILNWYHSQGYACANVVNFGNLNTPDIVCEVVEGDITGVEVQFLDKMNQKTEGLTNEKLVMRELPEEIKPGNIFNIEAGRKALQCISSLQLFANMEVNPRPDEDVEGGIVMEVKVREQEPVSAEVSTEWSIAPGDSGKPGIVSILPGGSVVFEHRNIGGLNRSVSATVSAGNLLSPQDDLNYKIEYNHPFLDGLDDPRNRVAHVTCFNNRHLSAVFVGGPTSDEVPAVWVDREGVKATISENFSRQSKLTYGAVVEMVTSRDENMAVTPQGGRLLPSGAVLLDGPPTGLGSTGVDRLAFLQANLTRDNTAFVNGTPVGSRDILQVDQGLFLGTRLPFFNRHQLSATRFVQLSEEDEENPSKPPWVGVLHAKYAGCVGDLPNYDAFALGGPYSVRGYNMGELGAARRILELAGEIRVPVKNTHAYAFAEFGTDLGSSSELRGNPGEFYKRAGYGGTYGAGVKLGTVRAEYARDCNMGTGAVFLRFGERF